MNLVSYSIKYWVKCTCMLCRNERQRTFFRSPAELNNKYKLPFALASPAGYAEQLPT